MTRFSLYLFRDVDNFVPSIQHWIKFYKSEGICIIHQNISTPSTAIRLWEGCTDRNTVFFLPTKHAQGLKDTLRKGVVGGLATVFHRLHASGITKIRDGPETVDTILGLDCTAQYLGAMSWMPCGKSEIYGQSFFVITIHIVFQESPYTGTCSRMATSTSAARCRPTSVRESVNLFSMRVQSTPSTPATVYWTATAKSCWERESYAST